MRSIVVLTTLPYSNEVVERIYEITPPSSIIEASDTDFFRVLERTKMRPFYSDYYWVILTCSNYIRAARELRELLSCEWVRIAYLCAEKGTYNKVREFLDRAGAGYDLFNCYKVSYFAKVRFVRKTFERVKLDEEDKLPRDVAHYIAKRLDGYESRLEFIMTTILKQKGKLSKVSLGKAMPSRGYVTVGNFMLNIFDPETKPEVFEQALAVVARYRNYQKGIIKGALEFFDTWELLYIDFRDGKLNEKAHMTWLAEKARSKSAKAQKDEKKQKPGTTKTKRQEEYDYEYDEVRQRRKLKEVDITTEYALKRWLRILGRYSYEFMTTLQTKLELAARQGRYAGYIAVVEIVAVLAEFNGREVSLRDNGGDNSGTA